ncbi:ABC transporter permease [Sphingosinicella sp. CPCC 101087]|uniref:ABC transporter permease n=1 Tax=Sphingosinicella sp. CPCC 101087 TaxID=2497754 RepID=UPI00101DE216|nr:FtsX-like permease family protein [Sphingosinicella sp. CPCC 101087]
MSAPGWRFAWRVARRDLHRSFRGLRLLFICLFLGVATLAAIGSLTSAITAELADRGRVILGGDVEVAMTQREASDEEKAALRAAGVLSETIRMRAMARRPLPAGVGPEAILTELKAVDELYPLYGSLTIAGGAAAPALAPDELLAAPALAERLSLRTGDLVRYGNADFRIAAIIGDEPDRVGEGFTLGPVAIVSLEGLRRTGLVQPGSLFVAKYRLRLPAGVAPETVVDALRERFPASSWEFKDRDRAAPGASRFFERMGQFLSLIGLAALIIAGIGVSNGVSSYLRLKREGIATLKALGATSGDIGRAYLLQIGLVTLAAVAAGLLFGALLPPAAIALAGDALPVRPGFAIHPLPLVLSAAYGILVAFIFVLPPLGRARLLPVAALFREAVGEGRRLDRRTWLPAAAAAVAVFSLAVATARDPAFAAAVLAAAAAVLLVLIGIGWAIQRTARRLPRPRRPLLRLAITGLYRPGAQTVALVVALGLALTLFVTLAAIQTSLAAEIDRTVPERAPSQFVLDIPSDRRAEFETLVRREAPAAELNIVPTLRGTITAFGGQRVAELDELPEGAWFLRGERGVTYSPTPPEGSELVEGSWWTEDYRGPPLVSIDREAAEVMGLGIGDRLTVSVLGREIEARIASLREIHWDTMGFNYILVFSPSALDGAPHNLAATIGLDGAAREGAVARALLAAFPSVSIIAVGEVIAQVGAILDQMSTAILLSASVAILAGIAVLIGAIAAARQARSYDSVILKTLGATRWEILAAQALEYALLAFLLATVSLALGLAGAWYVIVRIFEFGWQPDWVVVLATLGAGALLTLGVGLVGSLPLLSIRPARALREL